jgi:hypothetical protein
MNAYRCASNAFRALSRKKTNKCKLYGRLVVTRSFAKTSHCQDQSILPRPVLRPVIAEMDPVHSPPCPQCSHFTTLFDGIVPEHALEHRTSAVKSGAMLLYIHTAAGRPVLQWCKPHMQALHLASSSLVRVIGGLCCRRSSGVDSLRASAYLTINISIACSTV